MLRLIGGAVAVTACTALAVQAPAPAEAPPKAVVLTNVAWPEADAAMTASSVVVLPIGGGAVEHGPHLPLGTDERLIRYFASRIAAGTAVVVAPPLTYHLYPGYLDYPGSTSLAAPTARDVVVDIVRALARHGPHRFYAPLTSASPMPGLAAAAATLARDGILLGYTDPTFRLSGVPGVRHAAASHADDVETSMMLFVDPSAVDMTRAPAEVTSGAGPLTRDPSGRGIYSRSGAVGDASAASAQKGRALADALAAGMLDDIEKIRASALPEVRAAAAPQPAASVRPTLGRSGCTDQEEREIRAIGSKFSTAWQTADAEAISQLFDEAGDMRHPDGTIERGRDLIRDNRRVLFTKAEYHGSIHPLTLAEVRCLGGGIAVVDGKWELRNVGDKNGARTPYAGLCTLVVRGAGDRWLIEAWRYTVDPPNGPPPPNVLKTPGFIGRGGGLH